jgi:hypothetical protein
MHRIRITTAALVSSVALAVSAAPFVAQADEPDPCAKRQAQVDKAEAALARVTAVFAKQQVKVADAQDDVAEADNRSEKAEARLALKEAKADRADVAKVKKAQQMRLAKATERLNECTAAQPAPAS